MIPPRIIDFSHTPDPVVSMAARRYATGSRAGQGLSRRVTDPQAVARLGTMLGGAASVPVPVAKPSRGARAPARRPKPAGSRSASPAGGAA